MAKPIFTVGLPTFNHEILNRTSDMLRDELTDYYVLVYPTNQSVIQFDCFYESDFDEIKFDELKELIVTRMAELGILESDNK